MKACFSAAGGGGGGATKIFDVFLIAKKV